MRLPRTRFTIKRIMIATAMVAVTLAAEIAIVGIACHGESAIYSIVRRGRLTTSRSRIAWHGKWEIYYFDEPPLPLMIAVAAVPGVLAIFYPSRPD